jgi:putative glutamine amidotransferase
VPADPEADPSAKAEGERLPRIGLSTYRDRAAWGVWDEPADLLPATYCDAIERAGGAPLMLPPAARDLPAGAEAVLGGLHGLLLTGGPDVDPARYGAERDERTGPARTERDGWEIALTHAAIRRGMPVLGVCRGMQTLNVALGGTLVQHLPDLVGHDGHCAVVGVHGRHKISTAAGSLVAAAHGERVDVATYHHQAVDELAAGLVATAWADDTTIEAAELTGSTWVVGVQWHPEVHDGEPLFAAFVAACASWASHRW